jgi:hypothetical protein
MFVLSLRASFALLVDDLDCGVQVSGGELDVWRPEPCGDKELC